MNSEAYMANSTKPSNTDLGGDVPREVLVEVLVRGTCVRMTRESISGSYEKEVVKQNADVLINRIYSVWSERRARGQFGSRQNMSHETPIRERGLTVRLYVRDHAFAVRTSGQSIFIYRRRY